MEKPQFNNMRKIDIINSIADSFTSFFAAQKFKVKRDVDIVAAFHKNSVVELWLPSPDERYFGSYAMFRLTVDLKNTEEFLVILNNDGNFYFKLVRQSKRGKQDKSEYPRFNDFSELLSYAVSDNYDYEPALMREDAGHNDYFEESVSIVRMNA